MVILKTLLYALLILIPFGSFARIHVFSSVYVYFFDIVLFFLFVSTVVKYIGNRRKVRLRFLESIGIFVFSAFLSLALNLTALDFSEAFVSFLYLIRFVLYINLLFVFHFLPKDFNLRFRKLLGISGFTVVVFGFLQYIFYQNLRNLYYLGWDDHLYRLFSTFLDPNFVGAFFVLVLLLLLSFFFEEKRQNLLTKATYVSLTFLTFTAILLTYSRSTFLMLITSLVVYAFLIGKKRVLMYLTLLFLVALIFIPKDFTIENMNLFRTTSSSARGGSLHNAVTIFLKSPIYGVGFNAYRYAQREYGLLDSRWEITHAGAGVSNSYLFVLATTGIVGMAFFVNFWYRVVRYFLSLNKVKSKFLFFNSAVIASLCGVFVHSLFENTLFFPFILIWVCVLIGVRENI